MALKKEPSASDFRFTRSNWIQFSKQDSRHFYSGMITRFECKDYCPAVFRYIQELQDIDNEEYILSVCGLETLNEVSLPRKTGCLIPLAHDNRFLIKTLRKSEVKVIQDMLPNYCRHINKYGTTLLVKLYGLHFVRPAGGIKVYFVVMSNVLQSDLYIHKCYDLKGSSQGRSTNRSGETKENKLKDLDLDMCFYLDPLVRHRLLAQIKYDCQFLEGEGIMDYSLLVGVHNTTSRQDSYEGRSPNAHQKAHSNSFEENQGRELTLADLCKDPDRPGFRLGVKLPARAVRTSNNEMESVSLRRRVRAHECGKVLLYCGMIDIFQSYNVIKRLEHAYKSIQYDSKSISAVNPKAYSSRIQDFLSKVFLAEDSN